MSNGDDEDGNDDAHDGEGRSSMTTMTTSDPVRDDAPPRAMPPARSSTRRPLLTALAGAALVAALVVAAVWTPNPGASAATDMYAQFCTPVPEAAVVTGVVKADRHIDVLVPRSALAPDLEGAAHATGLRRGDVVELSITAPMAGAASVHGLSDLVVMKAGERATLRFRAIYAGRFPLHFHGADGSHYGVWALDIAPRPAS